MEYQTGADCQTAELSENYQLTNLSNLIGAEALQQSFQQINQSILVQNTNTIIYYQNQNENKTKTIDLSEEMQKKDSQVNNTQKESILKLIAQQKIFKDSSVFKTIKDEENNTSGFNQNLDFNLSQSGFEFQDQQTQFRQKGSYAVESFFDSQNDQQTQFQNHQVIQNLKKFKQNQERPQDQQDKYITINQKYELEKLILDHIKHSIVSKQNIKNILDSKNQLKLIKAADADYMNQTVFNKYARSFAQREGIQTNADVVLRDCKDKINDLYQHVADYFANNQVQNFQQFDFSNERQKLIDINNYKMFYQNNSGLSIQAMKDNNLYTNQNAIFQNSSSISAQAADKDNNLINQKAKNNIKFLYENTQLLHFNDLKRNSVRGQNSVGINQKSPTFEKKFDLNIQIKHKNSKRMSQMKSRRGSSDNQKQKNNDEQLSRIVLQKKGTQQITRNIMPLKLRAPVYTGLSNLQKRPSSQVANTSQMDKKHSQIDEKSSITYLGSSQRKTNEKQKTNSEIGIKADKKIIDNDLGVDGKTIQQLVKIPINDKIQLQQTNQLKQNQKNYGLLKIGLLNNQTKRNQDYAFTNSSQRNQNQIKGVEGILFQNNNKILRIESNNNLQNEYPIVNQSIKGKGLKMMPSSIQSFQTENLN